MILPFPSLNADSIKISRASLISLLILVLALVASSEPIASVEELEINTTTAMKVHPLPRKRNIAVRNNPNSRNSLEDQSLLNHKKLRRLPHVFSRVLELPFRSDADVLVEENPDCFRFIAETDGNISDGVRAHAVEIHPGVIKIVVRETSSLEMTMDELELDMWRFRLPETTRPELASAVFVDGELIVTVPKGNEENSDDGGGDIWGDEMEGRLVLVQ
ncbi:uncharacterized protein LOC111790497 [Cucurbita pepo subsp. pepo]|uniref:uncharacterized protein LOC111790497 n=1 Tax=Cucurbita pepo subsp. pepo TaxID=3664 RepID=UPI000C9D7AA5|nr:uncharacterized protein LOC111790497 [Cucurbita pepo subsp. pepo]